jgi:predicted ester cyclase/predicted SnoaL-like aldol condensation-catalyzing enzyme
MPPPIEGKEAIKEFFTEMFQTFPDLSVTLIRPPLVAGDIAVVEHIMTGTHLGDLDLGPMGIVPPTENSFQNIHMDIWEFEEGKVKKATTYDDMASQLVQLGILPAPEPIDPTTLVPSFTLPEPVPTDMTVMEISEELAARYSAHDAAGLAEMISPDAEVTIPTFPMPIGRDALIASMEMMDFAGFPDITAETVRTVDMGDGWALAERVFRGTHGGPYLGVEATGLPIELRAGILFRIDEDGLITNFYGYWDNLTVMAQLGLLAPPPPLPEVLPVGHHKLDMVYESVQDFALAPEERADGLYLVSTQEAIFDAREVILTFDDGTVLELTGRSRGEHQELKVVFDDAGVAVNAVGASYGTLEIFGPQDEVLFRGAYTAEDEATLSPEFQALGFSSKFKSVALGQNAYDGHTCTATVDGNMVPDPDDPEKLILLATGDAMLDKIITTKPPTGSHTTEAWFRYTQDYGLVPDQREDGLYLVSTTQAIAVCDKFTYVFDTGEEITGNVVASGDRQELKVIFDENGVPVQAVGTSYGVTMKGIDSYGNTREGVMSMKVSVDLSPDMQPVGMTGEMVCLAQLSGKFGNYIATDYLVATPEPDPEDPAQMVYHAMGTGEMTEVTGFSSVGIHSMQLQAGLNMISVPLKPLGDYTARSLAEELGATVVIRYDKETNSFVGFTMEMPDDGYAIEAGVGYIVNVLKPMEVEFMGTIWGNVSLPEIEAAPPLRTSAWAFLVSGSVLDGEGMSAEDGGYMLTAKNLRTGATAIEKVDTSGYFAAIWADLSRKAVAEAGDKVEVAVIDSRGKVVSGPFVHDITLDGIRNAVVKVQLRLGDIIPEKSALLQNYPNPFNPETWIPFHLKGEASVSIRIFNLSGQLIKTLDLGHMDAGVYVSRTKAAYWDGKNEAGEDVSSGIYFYNISAGDFSDIKKMIIRK